MFLAAAAKLGVVAVPVNYRFTDEEAAYITRHCDAVAAVHRQRAGRDVPPHPGGDPDVRTVFVHGGPRPRWCGPRLG